MFRPWLAASPGTVESRLISAIERRAPLWGVSDAFRLVNEDADGYPGVRVDRYGDWAVLDIFGAAAFEDRQSLAAQLLASGALGVYLKVRPGRDFTVSSQEELAARHPAVGAPAPEEFTLEEHGRKLDVCLGDGLATGLFVDQRENRERVRSIAAGLTVLNLFAYTGSFSVAAACGGARETTSVDLSRRATIRIRQNLTLNGLSEGHSVIKDDAVKWLTRAARNGRQYDLVILDPPSFARRGKGTFSVTSGFEQVATAAFAILARGGRLLAVTNHRGTTTARFCELLRQALKRADRQAHHLEPLPPALDCPAPNHAEPPTKSVLVSLV